MKSTILAFPLVLLASCAMELEQSTAEQASTFAPTAGTYASTGGPEHSTSPDSCGIGHGDIIVSDVTSGGYLAEFILPGFSFTEECTLNGQSATCAPRHSVGYLDLAPDFSAVLRFSGVTATQWTSATTFNLHDQGTIRCEGADCEAIGLGQGCVINGVQRFALQP